MYACTYPDVKITEREVSAMFLNTRAGFKHHKLKVQGNSSAASPVYDIGLLRHLTIEYY